MSRIIKLVILSFLLANPFAVSAESYSIGWEPWAPYQYQDESGKLTGLDIELVSAIMTEAKLSYEFAKQPWKRQLSGLQSGDLSIVLGASKTPEREVFANFSSPYRSEQAVLLISSASASKYAGITTLEDFLKKGGSVGVVREYYYGEDYKALSEQAAYKNSFKTVNDDEKNFLKLLNNRIDGMMVDPVAAGAAIKSNAWKGKFSTLFTVYSDDIFIMFSKSGVSQEAIDKVNASLAKMKSDGSYDNIVNAYLGE